MALLAAGSYWDLRGTDQAPIEQSNRAPLPEGWTSLTQYDKSGSGPNSSWVSGDGFSARVYKNTATQEIVISYAGTEADSSWAGTAADFTNGNIPLAMGQNSEQAYQAALLYQQVKSEQGPNITFTGHSLGGGLASLMAVWFDRPAYVFAPAPFQASADAHQVSSLPDFLSQSLALSYVRYKLGAAADPRLASYNPETDFSTREQNIKAWAVKGEFLEATLGFLDWIEASSTKLFASPTNSLDMTNKHFIDLHAAALLVPNFDTQASKLPTALERIFDANLYGYKATGNQQNFLVKLERNEVGIRDNNGAVLQAANGMLTHFANDLGKLGTNIAGLNKAAQDAIIAQEIEWYYWQGTSYAGKEFFADNTAHPSLLQYTTAQGDGLIGAKNKAVIYLNAWLTPLYNASGEFGGRVTFGQWNVATSDTAVTAAARDATKTQIFIGGGGADTFTGGNCSDVLLAGDGADTLDGGQGGDALYGGVGNDRYNFTSTFGSDIVLDADGQGSIWVDGVQLTGGKKLADNVWESDDGNYRFSQMGGNIIIGRGTKAGLNTMQGSITVQGWTASASLGITLDNAPVVNPVTGALFFNGDQRAKIIGSGQETQFNIVVGKPAYGTYAWNETSWAADGTLNGGVTEFDFSDVIDASVAGANGSVIHGWGGNDALSGSSGKDDIFGDAGDDLIGGGAGSDNIRGGDGNDYINSSATLNVSQRLRPTDSWSPPAGQVVLTQGALWGIYKDGSVSVWSGTNSPAGTDGDVVDAGAGNDQVIASAGDDRVQGGLGDDQIDGMGGNDVLEGGDGKDIINGDGLTQAGYLNGVAGQFHGSDFLDGGAGNDVLRGDGGNDVIYGGADDDKMYGDSGGKTSDVSYVDLTYHGNDYLDGEDGNDYIAGGGKDDTLYGGTGNDSLWGDTAASNVATLADNALIWGNDYLDGEDGDDTLVGGGKDDTLYGGVGNDTLFGDESNAALGGEFNGNDYLDGEDGNDQLVGGGKDDTLYGGAGDDVLKGDDELAIVAAEFQGADYLDGEDGNDTLFGGGGDDVMLGGNGNDVLDGGDGADYIEGGAGNDLLQGGDGADTYLVDAGGGQDTINDNQGINAVRFGAGVLPTGITFNRSGMDMVLSIAGTTDQITLKNWGIDSASHVSRIEFADGTLWDSTYLQAQISPVIIGTAGDNTQTAWFDQNTIMQGNDGNDILNGKDGNDYLDGGLGNDILNGGAGADTYVFKLGSGQDVIDGADYRDSVVFGVGISQLNLVASRSVNGLLLSYGSASDSVLIRGDSYPNELHFSDGSTLATSQLFTVENGGFGYAVTGTSERDVLADTHFWAATFSGGNSNDCFLGGGSDTTYQFNLGDGFDKLIDLGGQDTLSFGPGIAAADITFDYDDWDGYSPQFKIYYGSGYASGVVSILNGEKGAIERFSFYDGTSYSFAELATSLGFVPPGEPAFPTGLLIQPASSEQMIVGTNGNDVVNAFDDVEHIISGGKGDDRLQVASNDGDAYASLVFNSGDGHDTINVTANTSLVFGNGINPDSLTFGSVSRTYQNYRPFPGVWETITVIDTVISYGTQGDSIVVEAGLDLNATFEFADGSSFSYLGMLRQDFGLPGPIPDTSPAGSLSYQFDLGSGSQVLVASSVTPGQRIAVVQFGPGIKTQMLQLGFGPDSLLIQVGDSGDQLRILNFTRNDAYSSNFNTIEGFRFDDGTWLTYKQLIDLGFDLKGGAQDDVIQGTNAIDRIYGYEGNDTLNGGTGDDTLTGGTGNDTYLFGFGDGIDRIFEYDETTNIDRVLFNSSVLPGDVQVVRNGDDLELHLAKSSDTLILSNWYLGQTYQVEQVQFADGTTWDVAYLLALAPVLAIVGTPGDDTLRGQDGVGTHFFGLTGNDVLVGGYGNDTLDGGVDADAMQGGLNDDTYVVDNAGDLVVEGLSEGTDQVLSGIDYTLTDNVENLTLTGAASLSGTGNALDNVLTGNSAANVLVGGEGNDTMDGGAGNDTLLGGADNDSYILRVGTGSDTVQDAAGTDRVLVQGAFSAANIQLTRYGQDLSVGIKGTNDALMLKGWFSDIPGQAPAGMVESIQFANGSAAIDASYITGLLDNHAPTAVDDAASATEDSLAPTTGNVLNNDTDIDLAIDSHQHLSISGPGTYQGNYGQLQLAANGSYTYVLNNDLASVQALNRNDTVFETFSYTVQDNAVSNQSATAQLTITVIGMNESPVAAIDILAQDAREKEVFSFAVPGNAFIPAKSGDVLTYSAMAVNPDGSTQALSDWLQFDSVTRTFSGTPGGADGGSFDYAVTVTDQYGASASIRFTVDIADEFSGTGDNINVITGSWMNDTLNGTRRSETLIGNGGADKLLAGEGDNTIISYGGDTLITAGAGNDVITSSYGNDTIDAGNGNNQINAGGGNNVITAGGGDDTITTDWGMSTIHAGGGNNTVTATGGSTAVTTGAGNDSITTSWGNDVINAGAGNDSIYSGWGADVINAGAGDDLIRAGGGGDTVRGGLGNDTLINDQWSNDSYLFAAGDGQDSITDAGGQDQLLLENIDASQLWFTHAGNDLNINVSGTTDSITVKDWYSGNQYPGSPNHIETIKTSDGKTLLDSQVQNLVDAMAAFAPPAAGQTSLSAAYQSSLTPVLAANWQ
jgi:VCBS repeat-containing protein